MNNPSPIPIDTSKIGNAGHVVIPLALRKKYGLDKGNHVTWFEAGDVIILKPFKPEISLQTQPEPSEFDIALQNAGMTLEEWEEGRRQAAKNLLKELYGLDYNTLQDDQSIH
ncbi:MAG: AbrB/MazE/SpoVT family DNA-binding domain-containing protein [Anaerolineae bacterium]|nr:AbrB/MazE/SpoVT family DNA-binding domain-containing protein [Anaerolineae bacterium]